MYNQSLDIKKGFNLHSISALLTSWLITDEVCPAKSESESLSCRKKQFWEEAYFHSALTFSGERPVKWGRSENVQIYNVKL